jgi:tetratricopeptide (TPR) repeat protein
VTARALTLTTFLALAGAPAGAQPTAPAPAAPAPTPTPIADARARALLEEGLALYAAGRYDEAIERFQAGFAIEPREPFLYALGQAERRRGDCRRAIEYYEAFARMTRAPEEAAAARVQVERCRATLATDPPPPPPRPAATVAPTAAPRRPPATRTWRGDVLGHVLVGGGLVVAGVGGAIAWHARGQVGAAGDGYADFQRAIDAEGRQTIGALIAGGGLALAAAGVVHYVWYDGPVDVAPTAAPDAVGVVLTVRR